MIFLSIDEAGPAPDTDPNFWRWLTAPAADFPDRPAVMSIGQDTSHLEDLVPASTRTENLFVWTYSELLQAANKIASYCASKGLGHGDCLVVFLQTKADWALFYWASARLGTIFAPLNPAILDDEARTTHFLASLKPKGVIVQSREIALKFEQHQKSFDLRVKMISEASFDKHDLDSWANVAIANEEHPEAPAPPANHEHITQLLFTSGSTSPPKACPLGNQMIQNEITQLECFEWSLSSSSRLMFMSPAFMAIGYLGSLMSWRAGACVVFQKNDWTDPGDILKSMLATETTHIWKFSSKLVMLAQATEKTPELRPKSLDCVISSGEVNHQGDFKYFQDRLNAKSIISLWGMTEGCPAFGHAQQNASASTWPVATKGRMMTVGKALPGTAVKISRVSDSKNRPVLQGEFGELHVSSSAFIKAYLGGRGKDDFYQDSIGRMWFKTGDLSVMERHGYVYLLGRLIDQLETPNGTIVPCIIDEVVQTAFETNAHVCVTGVSDCDDEGVKTLVAVLEISQEELDQKRTKAIARMTTELEPHWIPDRFISLDSLGEDRIYMIGSAFKVNKARVAGAISRLFQSEHSKLDGQ